MNEHQKKVKKEQSDLVHAICWIIAALFVGSFFISCVNNKVSYQQERESMHEKAMHQARGAALCAEKNLQC